MKRVSPEAQETINRSVVLKATELGIERGAKVRTACTEVESNTHHPTDSSLLWDSVRVLVLAACPGSRNARCHPQSRPCAEFYARAHWFAIEFRQYSQTRRSAVWA